MHTQQSVKEKSGLTTWFLDLNKATHWRNFVTVEDQRDSAAAVVQVPAVGLALGGCLWGRRPGHGAHAPFVAGRGEAGEEAVLQTLSSGRAGRLPLLGAWRVQPAGAAATQHLVSHTHGISLNTQSELRDLH